MASAFLVSAKSVTILSVAILLILFRSRTVLQAALRVEQTPATQQVMELCFIRQLVTVSLLVLLLHVAYMTYT